MVRPCSFFRRFPANNWPCVSESAGGRDGELDREPQESRLEQREAT